MTNTEIISVVATVISLITVAVNVYLARQTILAKRAETLLTKQLDAFSEVAAALDVFSGDAEEFAQIFDDYHDRSPSYNSDRLLKLAPLISASFQAFNNAYRKNRPFIPPKVDNAIKSYLQEVVYKQFAAMRIKLDEYTEPLIIDRTHLDNVIAEMQKVIAGK